VLCVVRSMNSKFLFWNQIFSYIQYQYKKIEISIEKNNKKFKLWTKFLITSKNADGQNKLFLSFSFSQTPSYFSSLFCCFAFHRENFFSHSQNPLSNKIKTPKTSLKGQERDCVIEKQVKSKHPYANLEPSSLLIKNFLQKFM
jgi:hypothetical protein